MSSGWDRDWRLDEARARRLPQLEDLPQTGDGYDRAAVEAAFESFYRHAAEVDRTLDVLESVAAFQREARALRADVRALRAASWGPVPTLRHTVAATAAVGRSDRAGTPLESWPRIALYSAFIIFVAVGSAVADLSSGAIVALVLASWLVVGVAELAVSRVRDRVGGAPRGYPAWAAEDRVEAVAEPEQVAPAAVVAEAEPEVAEEVAEEAEEEPEGEQPRAWRPWSRPEEPEPVEEAEGVEEPEAEPVVEVEPEPEPEPERIGEPEPEFVPAPEPFTEPPEEAPEPEEIVPEVEPLAEAEVEDEVEPAAEAATEEPALEPEPVEPRESRRLRFWRRRPPEEPAALEPLPEPRHVRIVEVEEPEPAEEVPVEVEVAPAAEPPVRASGPVEGVRGNREAPPATEAAALEPEPEVSEDTEERPAVAVAPPAPLRLRRGRR